ncbi:hypothetical protein AN1V17_01230 [Vallitalea sediminicola]
MKEHSIKHVLKLISKEKINFDQVENYFNNSKNKEIHYYSIKEDASGNFPWKTIINIVIEDSCEVLETEKLREKYRSVRDDFLNNMNIKEKNTVCELYKQYYFGEELDRYYLIISFYSMNDKVNKIQREKNMMEHFNMEKKQNLYKLVHFNEIMDQEESNKDFQFVFESYMEQENHIDDLYDLEFIKIMREHSKGFLDVDTRKLAFGEVRVLKKS